MSASLLLDLDVQKDLEADGQTVLVGVARRKPYVERLVVTGIVLNQLLQNLGGFRMSHTCVVVMGSVLLREDIEKLIPKGAEVTAYDVGNGNTEFHIESQGDDPLGFLNVVINHVSPELVAKAKDALTKDELLDALYEADVSDNQFGTAVNNNTSESELIYLAHEAGILEGLLAEEEEVDDDSADQPDGQGTDETNADDPDGSGDDGTPDGEAGSAGAEDPSTPVEEDAPAGEEVPAGQPDAEPSATAGTDAGANPGAGVTEASTPAPTDAVANDGADPVKETETITADQVGSVEDVLNPEEAAPAAESNRPAADDQPGEGGGEAIAIVE